MAQVQFLLSPLDRSIAKGRDLRALLGGDYRFSWHPGSSRSATWLGWGRKPSGRRAERFAAFYGMSHLLLEDGFIRSLGLGNGAPAYSLVLDDLGIYYDPRSASRLEEWILASQSPEMTKRGEQLRQLWCEERVSKYNDSRDSLQPPPDPYILVVDQTWNDLSVRCCGADSRTFSRMIEAALDENPHATVVLKVHPEVINGRKRGYCNIETWRHEKRIRILTDPVHPASLLEHAQSVYTVSSQVGFEALLWKRRVRVFGMPFYAGWGLTHDECSAPDRRGEVPLSALIHGALVDYSRYQHPDTGDACSPEELIRWVGFQRRLRQQFPPALAAVGFSRWKHPAVRQFFAGSRIVFKEKIADAALDSSEAVVVWASRSSLVESHPGCSILRVEDGFIRSVGLGAELTYPLSWVIDADGIYYDASRPSRLENLLRETVFSEELKSRAELFRRRVLDSRISKYNVGTAEWLPPQTDKPLHLVVGQVESDASIRCGATLFSSNMELLQRVREQFPDAYLIYKPHPDVVAGLRERGGRESQAGAWCDVIVTRDALPHLLEKVQAIHVNTSLSGFEALLRGVPVHTYGQPFYAGWHLTQDHGLTAAVQKRRGRALHIDELVAAALILYPTYLNPENGYYTTPEQSLTHIIRLREHRIKQLQRPIWASWARPFRQWFPN